MADQFLHGAEVLDIDSGPRPIKTVRSSVIGIVGTAPDADPVAFPLDTPVLIAGSRLESAKLDMTGEGKGTLPAALDSILDQAGAVVIVIRVEEGAAGEGQAAATLANILGGVDANTGQYTGVHALLAAQSVVGFKPRILIAPGFTHQRVQGGVTTAAVTAQGAGYTDGTYTLTVTGGGGGVGAEITATVTGGKVVSTHIVKPGSGYTAAPALALPGGAGAGAGATFTATYGTVGNAVVAELLGIANRLRAIIVQDGTDTNDAAAIAQAGDFGSRRVYLCDPGVIKVKNGENFVTYNSPVVAGRIARTDNELGWWWSPSNQELNGIIGTTRPIDFTMGDVNCRANLLNESKVATIIREQGFRLWGNRTLSSDPKWAFLCIVRTADMINDSIQAAHLWAVDRGITKTYVEDVQEGVRAYLRYLTKIGAILGGDCWVDPELNSPDQISQGNVYWDFDFTGVYPAEHLTFRSHLVNNYIKEIF